jgi:hypothetical protein
VVQGVGPEFKPSTEKKKKQKNNSGTPTIIPALGQLEAGESQVQS